MQLQTLIFVVSCGLDPIGLATALHFAIVSEGVTSTDTPIRNLSTNSFAECAGACDNDALCRAIILAAESDTCQLHVGEVVVLQSAPGASLYFDYQYSEQFQIFYRVMMDDGLPWLDHQIICARTNGHLLTMKNQQMYDWLKGLLKTYYGGSSGTYHFDVDGTDSVSEGTWLDSQGEALWIPTDATLGSDCGAMRKMNGALEYSMVGPICGGPYSGPHGYVCQL